MAAAPEGARRGLATSRAAAKVQLTAVALHPFFVQNCDKKQTTKKASAVNRPLEWSTVSFVSRVGIHDKKKTLEKMSSFKEMIVFFLK